VDGLSKKSGTNFKNRIEPTINKISAL